MSEIEATCRELRPHLSAFIDGELDAALAGRVAAHAASCPDCGEDVAALREPGDTIAAALSAVTAPPGSVLRVLRRIERADVPTPRSRIATIALEVACAAAAVLLAALVFALTATERPASAAAPGLQRILGEPAGTASEIAPETPRTEADLLATIFADPRDVVFADERERSR